MWRAILSRMMLFLFLVVVELVEDGGEGVVGDLDLVPWPTQEHHHLGPTSTTQKQVIYVHCVMCRESLIFTSLNFLW